MQTESQGSEAGEFHYRDRPTAFDPLTAVSRDFLEFLAPLHKEFTPWQQALIAKRVSVLAEAHRGRLPNHLPASEATTRTWRIELPAWCQDQRNQMTGPADDAELWSRCSIPAHRA